MRRAFGATAVVLLLSAVPGVQAREAAPASRRAPTVAIVVSGDAAIAGPARAAIGAVAQQQGFRVIEGRGRLAETDTRPYARKADAVFFVDANPIGTTEVEYYGNLSTLYTAEVSLSAYRPSNGELLWSGPATSVSFSAMNAREKAEEALEPMLADVEQELRRLR
ncbi:hypothetical protein DFR29_102519 [Tahibacter aquaticus]|uniref:LPS-assembly lipoprotein n=1 Tax=Tahibacter aquaticus TaxID=520092 RepID=A0A4R6Z7S3_9GAMM|nr:hypothetical protein [Tahibacter aquaticus]TDR47857.1 hypothetical protein DFR29_102519 [Tahibacter aquaticus]